MRYLLDTHILLWAAADSEALPSVAKEIILSADNALYFSAASIWETAIKSRLGRPDFNLDPKAFAEALAQNGYLELPILATHSAAVYGLADVHKDPFDRILIAQAQCEDMKLLTADKALQGYGVVVEFVG